MDKGKTLKQCPYCGNTNIKLTNCRELEECANFEECDMDIPYFAYVCGINSGGCGASSGYYEHPEEALEAWNMRADKEVGAKDNNGKEICIGDKVKMHYFFENHDPITLGAYEDEKEIIGTVGADVWGTYTKTEDGRLYYWHDYLEDIGEEIEVIGGLNNERE